MRAILAVLALLPLAASAVPLQPPVCAETGTHDVVWGNGTVPVVSCRAFYAQGMRPAIKLPDDTASVVYGALEQRTMPVDGPGAVFWTRANKTYTVKAGVIPAAANPKDFSQIVYKAHVGKNGIVNHVEPAVFIDKEAVIRPFANTFFAGTVTNMNPPKGIPGTDLIWINIGSTIVVENGEPTLMGTVPNRYRPKSRGNTWCNYLSQSNATTTYYDSFMGPKNVAKLTWSPGMHDVFDSEVVLHFDNAASGGYMFRGPQLIALITTSFRPLWRKYELLAHGSPFGQFYKLNLVLRKGEKKCAK